jgi:hypothetical protein
MREDGDGTCQRDEPHDRLFDVQDRVGEVWSI